MQFIAILDQFKQIVTFGLCHRLQSEIIEDEEIDFGQSTEYFLIASIGPCDPQILKKSAGSFIAYCQTVSTGSVTEGAGEPAFTSPGRPGDVKVLRKLSVRRRDIE